MKTLTYEESVKLDPLGATQAELHDLCQEVANEHEVTHAKVNQYHNVSDTDYGYWLGKRDATLEMIEKLKAHDLWVK